MSYQGELGLLCDTFKKKGVKAQVLSPDTPLDSILDPDAAPTLNRAQTIGQLVGEMLPSTLYRHTDPIGLSYSYLLLNETNDGKNLLIIGPYILGERSYTRISAFCRKTSLSQAHRKYIEDFYSSVAVVSENSSLFSLLDSFCETMWGTSNYTIEDIISEALDPASPINNDDQNDVMMNMKMMEKRYAMENELMDAVTHGQLHRLKNILSQFPQDSFERRHSDPLRNMKNYGVIINTLLRKAAEQGGVHPMYLDKVSSSFAIKIEQLTSPASIRDLIGEMFTSYCRLVKKHSIKKYSPIIQKVIVSIDADLSADLSLSTLATKQNVSPGYLCTLFKKETGKTLIEYIREKRINHACHLLATTHLQIQTVAMSCGITDLQYFSKTFKKLVGKTPKEFREEAKNNAF